MKRFCLFSFVLAMAVLQVGSLTAQCPVGINLAQYVDWSPEFLFKDVFKSSREWLTFDMGSTEWDNGTPVPMTTDGYPTQVPFSITVGDPQLVRTVVLWDLAHGYPAGIYTLLWEGSGSIRVRHNGAPMSEAMTFTTSPGQFLADGQRGIIIEIMQSTLGNEVRNIRFVMPGFVSDFETQPFHPEILMFLEEFECIRLMNLMMTNNSPIEEWADRALPNYNNQTQSSGVAYEYLTQLCNITDKDIWVNIPHRASNDFVDQFAQFLHDNIELGRKIYIEYSNEVWNGIFSQQDYAAKQAIANGIVGDEGTRTRLYYALRSAEVFQRFESVFSDDPRLVKVVAHHDVNEFGSGQILNEFANNPSWSQPDALAIAPYMGRHVGQQICNDDVADTITIGAIIQMTHETLTAPNGVFENLPLQKALADAHGLMFFAYEGGQHLDNGIPACDNNSDLTQKLTDANRSLGMGELYEELLNAWYDNGGELFMHYSSHTNYNQHGSFGLKEYLGQPDEEAPKYLALLNTVQENSNCFSPAKEQKGTIEHSIHAYPNPTSGALKIEYPTTTQLESVEVANLQGQILPVLPKFSTGMELDVSSLPPGMYVLRGFHAGEPVTIQRFVRL